VWVGSDNDFAGAGPVANSFGSRAHGTVTNPVTGDALEYLAMFRVVTSPEGEIRVPVATIRLR